MLSLLTAVALLSTSSVPPMEHIVGAERAPYLTNVSQCSVPGRRCGVFEFEFDTHDEVMVATSRRCQGASECLANGRATVEFVLQRQWVGANEVVIDMFVDRGSQQGLRPVVQYRQAWSDGVTLETLVTRHAGGITHRGRASHSPSPPEWIDMPDIADIGSIPGFDDAGFCDFAQIDKLSDLLSNEFADQLTLGAGGGWASILGGWGEASSAIGQQEAHEGVFAWTGLAEDALTNSSNNSVTKADADAAADSAIDKGVLGAILSALPPWVSPLFSEQEGESMNGNCKATDEEMRAARQKEGVLFDDADGERGGLFEDPDLDELMGDIAPRLLNQ